MPSLVTCKIADPHNVQKPQGHGRFWSAVDLTNDEVSAIKVKADQAGLTFGDYLHMLHHAAVDAALNGKK